ncbi:ABC transporter ATP-binding protein [Paraburkholderia dipogonis]|uniref:ABC transporter ATP-binding protein n=1 Tax=Paraburkholderia dipogonis TaxID=1211383 RepID=UPI0038B8DC88
MANLSIHNVKKSYGSHSVIQDISVDIPDGEFAVLVGPSGCGKSTLLRMIAGLEDITSGQIRVAGQVMNDVSPKNRDMAMVFQNYALYPHMTVGQNMGFSLKISNVPKAEIEQRVGRAAEILALGPLLERYPRQLSGGQRQRVAMGRAIVRDPQVFLFDEPLSNLDAKLRVAMRTEIKQLHQRLRTTTVYVTHDQVEAMTLADRIVVMRDGVVEQVGAPLEVYDQPRNVFVAGFIGSPAMNFLRGALVDGDKETVFRSDSSGLTVRLGRQLTADRSRPVILGIRPEHFVTTEDGTPTEVVVVETTGSATQVNVRYGSDEIICEFRERVLARPGERLCIAPLPHAIHLFDAETGRRLPEFDRSLS